MEQAKIDQETEKNELIISEKNEGLEKINDIVNNVNEQAKDKKKKKKKKNKNEDERAEHQIDDINNNEGVTTNDPPNFEDEIKWCTTQIKMGIKFNNLDKDQSIIYNLIFFIHLYELLYILYTILILYKLHIRIHMNMV